MYLLTRREVLKLGAIVCAKHTGQIPWIRGHSTEITNVVLQPHTVSVFMFSAMGQRHQRDKNSMEANAHNFRSLLHNRTAECLQQHCSSSVWEHGIEEAADVVVVRVDGVGHLCKA